MAAADGLTSLVTPYNTAKFEAMVADAKAHFNATKGQLEVIAADLRRLLPHARNASGRMAFGIDLRIAAVQIGRQFSQAAGAQNSASAAVTRAMELYHGNFTATGSGPGGRRFDAA